MRLNPNKIQIVSRSGVIFPSHPKFLIVNISLNSCDSVGVTFDSKFTFENYNTSISSSVGQKIDLLRKSFRTKMFQCFHPSSLEFCFPAWSSAAHTPS